MISSDFLLELELVTDPYSFAFWRKDFVKKIKPEHRKLFIVLMKSGFNVPISMDALKLFENIANKTPLSYDEMLLNQKFINIVVKHTESKLDIINFAHQIAS